MSTLLFAPPIVQASSLMQVWSRVPKKPVPGCDYWYDLIDRDVYIRKKGGMVWQKAGNVRVNEKLKAKLDELPLSQHGRRLHGAVVRIEDNYPILGVMRSVLPVE